MKLARWMTMALLIATTANAELRTRNIDYKHGDVVLQGYLVYEDSLKKPLPGVLVIHEWWGLNDYAKSRAEQLAKLGYMAFALDMYGKGVLATTYEEAAPLASAFKDDRQLTRDRALAGLKILRNNPLSDPNRIAAIGYCFGGMVALELARSGDPLAGVVSFHGGLDTPNPKDARSIKGKVLVCHGSDDPHVPTEDVLAFQQEMRSAGVDWQMIYYGGAAHAFSNPESANAEANGVAYNADADRRSWRDMQEFFQEILK